MYVFRDYCVTSLIFLWLLTSQRENSPKWACPLRRALTKWVVVKYLWNLHWGRNILFRLGIGFDTLASNSLLFATCVSCIYMDRERKNTKRKWIFTTRVKMHITFRKLYAPALQAGSEWLKRRTSKHAPLTAGVSVVIQIVLSEELPPQRAR